jgi:hypothetical protein
MAMRTNVVGHDQGSVFRGEIPSKDPRVKSGYAFPQMFLNRPGASAAYRVVELVERWPK